VFLQQHGFFSGLQQGGGGQLGKQGGGHGGHGGLGGQHCGGGQHGYGTAKVSP